MTFKAAQRTSFFRSSAFQMTLLRSTWYSGSETSFLVLYEQNPIASSLFTYLFEQQIRESCNDNREIWRKKKDADVTVVGWRYDQNLFFGIYA